MIRFFLQQLRSDLRSHPATECVEDAICLCLAVLFVVCVAGLMVGVWG